MYNFTTKEQVHNHGYEAVGKTLKALAENMDMKVSGKNLKLVMHGNLGLESIKIVKQKRTYQKQALS